jgi:C4-dicarboxylate transporter, DctM subunit
MNDPLQTNIDVRASEPDARTSSAFGALTRVMNVAGTILILLIAVAVNSDVIGRDFFNKPIPGVVEFIGLSIVAVVFLQMANTLRENRHVTNDMVIDLVDQSRPEIAHLMRGAFNIIGGIMMCLTAWFVWPMLVQNFEGGYFKGTAGLVEIPIWPAIAAVVFGAAVTAVQFFISAVDHFRSARRAGKQHS